MVNPASRLITAPLTQFATALNRVAPPLIRELVWPGALRPRTCVACGHPVRDHDAFLRYRGEYFHAEPCVERDLPALHGGPSFRSLWRR